MTLFIQLIGPGVKWQSSRDSVPEVEVNNSPWEQRCVLAGTRCTGSSTSNTNSVSTS
jgi:hypothetical protein